MAKRISKEIERLIIDNFNNGKSPYWMVNNVEELKGKRPSVIYGILERLRLKPNKSIPLTNEQKINRRKYNVDDDYFENIDTEHKAYWLGFLYADGFLLTNKNKVGLTLSIEDKDHIEKFKNDVKSESPVKIYNQKSGYSAGNDYARLLITSEKMKNDLINHGVVENKTQILKFPNLRNDLINHFIRGYFDGDGCLTTAGMYINGNKKFNIKIVGTKDMISNIQKCFGTNLKIIQRYPNRNVDNWTLTINGNVQVKNIMEYLYNDSTIYLERKYKKYLELINQ